jgi:hypothetical protein
MFFYVLLHAHILEEIALNDGRFIYQFEGKFYEAFTASELIETYTFVLEITTVIISSRQL